MTHAIEGDTPFVRLDILAMTHDQRIAWLRGVRERRERMSEQVTGARKRAANTSHDQLAAKVERLASKLKGEFVRLDKLLEKIESRILDIRATELAIAGMEEAIEVMKSNGDQSG